MEISKFLSKNWRYIVFFVTTAVVLTILYLERTVLLPFLLGLVMAYLFMPIIRWLERIMPGKGKHMATKRVLAIFIVLVSIMGIFAFAAFITVTYIAHSGAQMMANASVYINNFIAKGKEWTSTIRNWFPAGLRSTVDNVVQSVANSIAGTLSGSVPGKGGGSFLSGTLGAILGFAAVPLFLFYILKDSENCVNSVCSSLGKSSERHMHNILNVIEKVLGRYIRAQFALSAILFTMTLIGLLIIRAPLAVPLAFIYGVGELIPTFGVWIAGAIMVIVVLALAPDKVIWVIVMDLIVKLIENIFLVPRIQAKFMRLHPAVVIVLLVLGAHFWGLWGMVLTVPIAATIVELFKYVRSLEHENAGATPKLAGSAAADPPKS